MYMTPCYKMHSRAPISTEPQNGLRLVFLLMVIGRVLAQNISERRNDDYTYDIDPSNPYGVINWHKTYPTCNGERQSPVDIQTEQVRYVRHKCPKVNSLTRIAPGTLQNTGLTVKFKSKIHNAVKLKNVPHQSGVFYFHNFHVHYGGTRLRNKTYVNSTASKLHPGAEHTVNGKRFDGEVHLVFYNSKYGTLKDASQHEDGLAVIARFVKIVPDDKIRDKRFTTFLEQNLPLVFGHKSKTKTDVDVSMFLDGSCALYTYQGSLTTTLCNETVTWVVLRDPIEVTFRAWTRFVFVKSRGGYSKMYGNFRTTMSVRNRVIEANFLQPDTPNPKHQDRNMRPQSKTGRKQIPLANQGEQSGRKSDRSKKKQVTPQNSSRSRKPRVEVSQQQETPGYQDHAGYAPDLNIGQFQTQIGNDRLSTRRGSYREGKSQRGQPINPEKYPTRAGGRRQDRGGRSNPRGIPRTGPSAKRRPKASNPEPYVTRGRSQRRLPYPDDISQAGRSSRHRRPSSRRSRGQYRDNQIADRTKVQAGRRIPLYIAGTPESLSARRHSSFKSTHTDGQYPVSRESSFGPLTSAHDNLHYDNAILPSYTSFGVLPVMADKYSPQYPALGSINMPTYMNAIADHVVAKQLRIKDHYLPIY